jgi:peptide/nickel transport system substrate-binding protein
MPYALRRDPLAEDADLQRPDLQQQCDEPEMGFLKDFMTRFRVPEGTNWGWYQNAEVDKLGAEVMQTFDDVEQTKILQRLHEIAVEEAARIFIVHDLNPRALSPRVIGFVQARSWYQDLTPIVVTSPPN